jgi:hypothetical protein
MSLPMTPNVAVDIYRTANPSSPYSLGALSASGVPGFLQPSAAEGRFGTASWLKWTHILLLPAGTDARDAYNSQLDPARNNNNADTIILNDSAISGRKTAYYVVFVEVIARALPEQHMRAYLDRFAPSAWPTDSI